MILYNLFPLLAGPMSQWGEHFTRAAELGFDWVFINPIQKPGASKSLYSIADYFGVNPVLLDAISAATPEEQVRQMTSRAKAAGLKVMMDLVINHCAIDSGLTREHPEWFVRDHHGAIAKSSCQHNGEKVVWHDLARFNHRHSKDGDGLFGFCLRVVEHLIGLGFEGFRCDAAYQVPASFWRRLIREVKGRHPGVCFAAETLGCSADETNETARAGFDYVFNSSKWWDLHGWWLIEQYNLIRENSGSISFPESHDTPRLCEEVKGNVNALKQRYLLAALFSAGVMMPMGFEFGMRKALHVIDTTPADWQTDGIDLCSYVASVNRIKKNHQVFLQESVTSILHCHNPSILLLWKASAKHKEEALLILNRDVWHHQDFRTDNFRHFVQSHAPLRDVSPEFPLDYLHEPFHYGLRPGQGIVLVTSRG
jgi:starch synthase (maltosyl-transferring)